MPEALDISIEEKAGVYAFLKVVFSTEPSTALLKYLQTPEVLDSLRSTGACLSEKDFSEPQLPQLLADYTRLFIGPMKHISLNESIYTEKTPQFWGDATVKISKLVDYLNLTLDEKWTQMPDHIVVEFELMQKLLEAKSEALNSNDQQTVQQCAKAINSLYDEHIVQWVPQVCDQVIDKAQTSAYKAIGMWTKTFIQCF